MLYARRLRFLTVPTPVSEMWFDSKPSALAELSLSVGHSPPQDMLLDYIDPVVLHGLLMHLPQHTLFPHLWIVFVKLSRSVFRHDHVVV